jgi:hypothetical protein
VFTKLRVDVLPDSIQFCHNLNLASNQKTFLTKVISFYTREASKEADHWYAAKLATRIK